MKKDYEDLSTEAQKRVEARLKQLISEEKKKETGSSTPVPAARPAKPSKAARGSASTVLHAASKKKCSSGLKGDYAFETCGLFCKQNKAANHCKCDRPVLRNELAQHCHVLPHCAVPVATPAANQSCGPLRALQS